MSKLFIGIDTGKHTGFSVWDSTARKFIEVSTLPIHRALERVAQLSATDDSIFVIVEDARQRKWFGDRSQYKQQGAGSVKRDAVIWEDFLTDYKIPFKMVAPMKGGTKWTKERFEAVTGWKGRTSEHSRDACMIVFGR